MKTENKLNTVQTLKIIGVGILIFMFINVLRSGTFIQGLILVVMIYGLLPREQIRKNIRSWLLTHRPHRCRFSKPLASQYVSFHTRNIISECSCGKRRLELIMRSFADDFPIATNNMISDIEMRDILNGGPVPATVTTETYKA